MEAAAAMNAEARSVLNQYLGLFQQNSIDFKYHLAPNSVIDWYGRTIRGANKIHDYLRHEIHNQLDHMEFVDAAACDPIETKTSHMRTKIMTTKPIDMVHPINRVPDMVPLKSYADSDVEDTPEQPATSAFLNVVVGRRTPEKCHSSKTLEDLTPPASATKEEAETPVRATTAEEESNNRRHQLKRTHTGRFSYLKRLPTAPSTSKRGRDEDGVRTLLDDSSSDEDELETMEALYSPLKYLEVTGTMLIKANANNGKFKGSLWRDRTQLETRLRISYRRKLEDQQIQFALIIYEALNGASVTPTRRNLMTQFSMSLEETTTQQQQQQQQQPPINEAINEQFAQETVGDHVPTITTAIGQSTNDALFASEEDPLQEETSWEMLSTAQMRTPTKFSHTPPATPKRRPRSMLPTTSGVKRMNNSPSAPTPKRSAARSLRL